MESDKLFDPEYADKVRAGLLDLNSVYWSPLSTVFMEQGWI